LHEFGIIGNRINYGDFKSIDLLRTYAIQVYIFDVSGFIAVDSLAALIKCISVFFRGRAAIANIIFDAKIFVRAAGIMAGGKNQSSKGIIFSYDM
jgi:hypothetical protein